MPVFANRADKLAFIAAKIHARVGRGLEIGPGIKPMFRRSDGFDVRYLEAEDSTAIAKRCRAVGEDPSQLEGIDYVFVPGHRLIEQVGDAGPYLWVASSHVIEHIPDLVGHFQEVTELLGGRGGYGLLVPDKDLCFDRQKPASTLGRVIEAHLDSADRLPVAAMVDELRSAIKHPNGAVAWDRNVHVDFVPKHDAPLAKIARLLKGDWRRQVGGWGGHRWQFTPASLTSILFDLRELELISLDVIDVYPTPALEFLVVLAAGGACGTPLKRDAALAHAG